MLTHTHRPQRRAHPNIDKTRARCFSIPHLRMLGAVSVWQWLWELQGNLTVQRATFWSGRPQDYPRRSLLSFHTPQRGYILIYCMYMKNWMRRCIYIHTLETSPFTTQICQIVAYQTPKHICVNHHFLLMTNGCLRLILHQDHTFLSRLRHQ